MEAGDWLLSSDVIENGSAIIVYIFIDPGPQLAFGSEDAICTPLQTLLFLITVSMFLLMFLLQYVHIKINLLQKVHENRKHLVMNNSRPKFKPEACSHQQEPPPPPFSLIIVAVCIAVESQRLWVEQLDHPPPPAKGTRRP